MRIHIIDKWKGYFNDIGIPKDLANSYIEFVELLLNNDVPPIFEFDHLAKLLGRTNDYLASAINGTKSHYRYFEIPKRKGGTRGIRSPYPALLDCQRWILCNILSKVKIFKTAHGFVKRKNIKTNAELHLKSKYLLKLDIEDFFGSINIERVIGLFRRIGYPSNVSFYLARLCCLDGSIPQGAATSPCISNVVSYKMDIRLFGLARKFNLIYTRYADDMAFSGKYISRSIIKYVQDIINEEGFRLNEAKTRLYRDGQRKILTGISITNEVLVLLQSELDIS